MMSCNILLIFSAGYIREIIENYTLYHYNHSVNAMALENISFWIGLSLTKDQCWMWTDEQHFIFSSWAKGKFLKVIPYIAVHRFRLWERREVMLLLILITAC